MPGGKFRLLVGKHSQLEPIEDKDGKPIVGKKFFGEVKVKNGIKMRSVEYLRDPKGPEVIIESSYDLDTDFNKGPLVFRKFERLDSAGRAVATQPQQPQQPKKNEAKQELSIK